MASLQWLYPGSRWWKFDFHTHTPASKDTSAWQNAIGTPDELTSESWLLKYMAAEIDCVAITDHNSGAWIDRLKTAYANMKARADAGQAPEGFRELTLFPGVEISVCGGFHLLAIFEPNSTTRTITDLLAAIDYQGTDGDSDGVTREGPERVIEKIWKAGGIPIPAHADRPNETGKGLLACRDGSGASRLDANTIRGILDKAQLLAIEWEDMNRPAPECVKMAVEKLTRVLGSDCHSFRGTAVPGSRYTWVKMAKPTLEGLRLALLDGNGVSIQCSDQGVFDPFQIPGHIITTIEIDQAHYMGNGQPAKLGCSPYFNAIVGGRGTGKSTVVHALRLATRREQELKLLGEQSEPWEQFEAFRKIAKGRYDKGALYSNTELCVEWKHDETLLRLRWRADGQGSAVEEWNEERGWQPSASQSINPARFPLRIFSQGQIAAMAGSGRQTLLSIIDEAANVEPRRQSFEEAKRTFFTQRARLRELDGKLAGQAEVVRKLDEVGKKLAALSQADHTAVLHAYALVQHQTREIEALLDQLRDGATRIADLPQHIVLDDWPSQHFTEQDADLLAWRRDVEQQVEQVRAVMLEQAQILRGIIESMREDTRVAQWRGRAQVAQQVHTALQQRLAEQGVNDPQAFTRLTQERQQLEAQQRMLQRMDGDRRALVEQIEAQQVLLLQRRQAITEARQSFIQSALADNLHVQIAVVPFGSEAKQIERELRALIDVTDERFADDILSIENGEASGGMAFDLAQADEASKAGAVDAVKNCLLNVDTRLGGYLRNYLRRKHEKFEFADYILAWFPEDDLRIEYQRGGQWTPISQGSQGQRSAALLAFLLAFGEEPIVLDQPEDDLDNHLIYDLIVRQIRENKLRRQLIIVTHNPNVVVNGDAELVHVMEFGRGQCFVKQSGALQESAVRHEVCQVMEGGPEAFARRWKRLGREV